MEALGKANSAETEHGPTVRHTRLKWVGALPALGVLLGLGLTGAAEAQNTQPAVAYPDFKIAVAFGLRDSDSSGSEIVTRLFGSYTAPLTRMHQRMGFQVDLAIGFNDEDQTGGLGGHVFWRDPSRGLAGVIASYAQLDRSSGGPDADAILIGGEGEYYRNRLTLSVTAGHQFGDETDNGIFARGGLGWYFHENLLVGGSAGFDPQRDMVITVNSEYQLDLEKYQGVTVFGNGLYGDDEQIGLLAGVRLYFGGNDKSLQRRHREDDPVDNVAMSGMDLLGTGAD